MSIAEEDKNLPLENRWKLLWGKLLGVVGFLHDFGKYAENNYYTYNVISNAPRN